MACRGVLFAIEQSDVDALRAFDDEDDRVEYVGSVIEERGVSGEWAAETDKAWDAIHRCFDHGNLTCNEGEYPLNLIILGGEHLCTSGSYYIALKTPEQVREVATEIVKISREELRRRYRLIKPRKYGMKLTDEDEQYTWEYFAEAAELFKRAARAGRWVIFTVDQ